MIDLNELQFFVQVGKTQSFTLAARELGTQKSSVSRAIANLEARLGVRLLERTTRRVALTEAGELFLDKCMRVLEEAEHADQAINALHIKPRGRLRVGAPVAYARFVLAPILGDFLKQYPDIKLNLMILQGPPSPTEADLDVAIRQGPLDDSVMRVMPLKQISLGLYASAGYVKASGVPRTPAELREHRCITTRCGAHGEPSDFAKLTLRNGTQTESVRVEAHVSLRPIVDPTDGPVRCWHFVALPIISGTKRSCRRACSSLARLGTRTGATARCLWIEPEIVAEGTGVSSISQEQD